MPAEGRPWPSDDDDDDDDGDDDDDDDDDECGFKALAMCAGPLLFTF